MKFLEFHLSVIDMKRKEWEKYLFDSGGDERGMSENNSRRCIYSFSTHTQKVKNAENPCYASIRTKSSLTRTFWLLVTETMLPGSL